MAKRDYYEVLGVAKPLVMMKLKKPTVSWR